MTNIPVTPPTMDSNSANKRSLVIMGILLGLILIANIAYYFIKKPVSSDAATAQVDTAVSAQKASYEELNSRYVAAMAQLDSLRIIVPGMEQKITEQQAELEQQRQQIAAKIQSGDLAGANQQIEDLTRQKDQFMLEAARLRSEVSTLRTQADQINAEKTQLQSSNQYLAEQLATEQRTNTSRQDELAAAKAERDAIQRRLEAQAYLPLTSVKAQPIKVNKKGNGTVVKNPRDVDQINVTFSLPSSELVTAGMETFYIQIIDPNATVNSQTMRNPRTGKDFSYTFKLEHSYTGQAEEIKTTWDTGGIKLTKGKYKVVVWHRGREVGESTFELKSSFF